MIDRDNLNISWCYCLTLDSVLGIFFLTLTPRSKKCRQAKNQNFIFNLLLQRQDITTLKSGTSSFLHLIYTSLLDPGDLVVFLSYSNQSISTYSFLRQQITNLNMGEPWYKREFTGRRLVWNIM